MAVVLRGELWWADLDPVLGREQGGPRPMLVISPDAFNARSGTCVALAVTSVPQQSRYPLVWEITSGGLPRRSWVKLSQVRTLSMQRLRDRIGTLAEDDLARVLRGFRHFLRL
jgi:mRNA interferase MazF